MHTFYEDKNVQLSVFCFPFGIFCFPPTEGFIKFNRPDGPIMGELMDTKILKEREKITTVVTKAVALGMAGRIVAKKKK